MIYSIAPSGRRPNVLPSPAEQSKSATGKSVRFSGLMAASSSTRLVKIIAPAGGLGIVVKASPESGLSYVSRIKDNSPIKDQIRVGDLILEVDGEDVSKLRVIHVASKFMIAYCSMGCV